MAFIFECYHVASLNMFINFDSPSTGFLSWLNYKLVSYIILIVLAILFVISEVQITVFEVKFQFFGMKHF
jgi:hypothetical protein